MTLDEAIKHCKEQAKIQGVCDCAAEHSQLAEWLEELKGYRQREVEPVCETCHGTGFYGDNGPGILGNTEYDACGCGNEIPRELRLHGRLAEAEHQAKRNLGHLEELWKYCGFEYEWEYTGQLTNHIKAHIQELRDKPVDVSKEVSDRLERHIQRNTPIDQSKRIEMLEEEVRELLTEYVADTCTVSTPRKDEGALDSCAISGRAEAMRRLAELGTLEIISDKGRRVIAKWKEQGK